ncbi:tRNA (adenine(58)-N(1))-methyltransferase catalytic subunit TRMT61A-like [Macrobrachium nipponense]|uniref:tRNA (adenine(58)-N(1))-methyltransferase catalytic subunit TRMT61A-like n=1 Tax=Macrobrachium nipponense TaxID=159736 RepID=UPI0030C7C762
MSFSSFKKLIEVGDTVILYISVNHLYAIEVKPKLINKNGIEIDNVFQTRYGCLTVADLVGKPFGSKIILPKGWVHVLYPTPELWTVTLPHRTQILYTPDISMVITQLEIGPGSVVCEAGTGSGSLSHALLRAIGSTGKLHTCDFHKERVQAALDEFTRHGFGDRVTLSHRDVCVDGLGVEGVADAVFLDLPKPWEALPHAVSAMKIDGGRICSFSPCIEQVCRTCETMSALGLREITTMECLAREFQVKNINLPVIPSSKDVDLEGDKKTEKFKKIKLDNEATDNVEMSAEISTSDEMLVEETSNKNLEAKSSESARPNLSKEYKEVKFLSGITNLKMPGHTGYLTFATVPPGLRRTIIASNCPEVVEDKLSEDAPPTDEAEVQAL